MNKRGRFKLPWIDPIQKELVVTLGVKKVVSVPFSAPAHRGSFCGILKVLRRKKLCQELFDNQRYELEVLGTMFLSLFKL